MSRVTAAAMLFGLLAGCASLPSGGYRDRDVPISSAAAFDVQRYAGLWYEIARFPVPFQAGCEGVTARYTANADGTVDVLNTCRDGARDGPERQISGTATVTGLGRLSVGFQGVPFIKGPYWVLWVDEGYRTAVVGVPSGRAGWILNRTPDIPADRLKAALEVLDFNGYDTSRLRRTAQPPAP